MFRLTLRAWSQEPKDKYASPPRQFSVGIYRRKMSEGLTKDCDFPFFPGGTSAREQNDGERLQAEFYVGFSPWGTHQFCAL